MIVSVIWKIYKKLQRLGHFGPSTALVVLDTLLPFLTSFETDNPKMPFLSDTIEKIMRRLMQNFVKKEVSEETNTAYRLQKVDLTDKKILLLAEQVIIVTAAKNTIKSNNFLPTNSNLEKVVSEFLPFVNKLEERCPLKYATIRNSSSFLPCNGLFNFEICKIQLSNLGDKLYGSKWISEKVSEDVKVQLLEFISSVFKEHQSKFKTFDLNKQRIDEFRAKTLHSYGLFTKSFVFFPMGKVVLNKVSV